MSPWSARPTRPVRKPPPNPQCHKRCSSNLPTDVRYNRPGTGSMDRYRIPLNSTRSAASHRVRAYVQAHLAATLLLCAAALTVTRSVWPAAPRRCRPGRNCQCEHRKLQQQPQRRVPSPPTTPLAPITAAAPTPPHALQPPLPYAGHPATQAAPLAGTARRP